MRAARVLPRLLPLLLLLFWLAPASPALAHDGVPPAPHDLAASWNGEPTLLVGLTALALLYLWGLSSLWTRAGTGRGVRRWQASAFGVGLVALFAALVSPLDALSEALFSAHMAQHLLLTLVAAPLLALGQPLVVLMWALPLRARHALREGWKRSEGLRRLWRGVNQSLTAWVLHTGAIWFWHLPAFYEAALRNDLVHELEHASFLGTALLFWWTLYRLSQRRQAAGSGVFYLFTTGLQGSALGALMTFAPVPWYASYAPYTAAWGLSPLEDQQLGGVLMWVPMGIVYLTASLLYLVVWWQALERRHPSTVSTRRAGRSGAWQDAITERESHVV